MLQLVLFAGYSIIIIIIAHIHTQAALFDFFSNIIQRTRKREYLISSYSSFVFIMYTGAAGSRFPWNILLSSASRRTSQKYLVLYCIGFQSCSGFRLLDCFPYTGHGIDSLLFYNLATAGIRCRIEPSLPSIHYVQEILYPINSYIIRKPNGQLFEIILGRYVRKQFIDGF